MYSAATPPHGLRALAFACTSLCLSASAVAQTELEEIVVTADFRERAAADVPASITVIDSETIQQSTVQHFEELIARIPNLNWSGDGHRARYLQIRGVGELAQYQGAPNPSVGFIVDDIDFSGIGSIATLFDVEQVEILRGPQGTRYGANAIAGLVNVRSAEPNEVLDGLVRLGAGDDNEFSIGAAIGGPIGNDAGFRVSAQSYSSDGFRHNPYLGRSDTNGRDETTVRGKFAWQLNTDWNFKLTAMFSDVDNGYDAFAIDNSLTVLSNHPGQDAQESAGGSFRATWTGNDSFELVSISSFADSDIIFSFDADWGNEEAWAPVTYDYVSYSGRQRQSLSQEVRLTSTDGGRLFNDSADWLVGAYFNRMDEDLVTINTGDYFDPASGFADTLDDLLTSRFEARNAALFGQLDFALHDDGVLSVGLRLESRSTDYTDTSGLNLGPSETMLGGEVSYRHTFDENITGYLSLSRGYKAGGFNLGFVPDNQREFTEEALWNAEVGLKSTLVDGRIRLNASLFYYLREDQQVETSMQLNPNDPASFVFFTDNAAEGDAFGLETDLVWLPAENVELFASLGLLHAQFRDFSTALSDLGGRDQAHAPRYTFSAGGIFRFSEAFFARLDVTAKDDFYFDVSHDQKSAAYALTNVRLGYEADRWTGQIYVRNLFDEHYAVRGFYFGNEPPDFPPELYIRQGDPRQVGVIFEMRY